MVGNSLKHKMRTQNGHIYAKKNTTYLCGDTVDSLEDQFAMRKDSQVPELVFDKQIRLAVESLCTKSVMESYLVPEQYVQRV